MERVENTVQGVKETVTSALPTPPEFKSRSSASDLKQRLDWGEPALTIIDARSRDRFNEERITGAMSVPPDQFATASQTDLETNRDIYVYGETDAETAQAAAQWREAGFSKVAELQGGLAGWQAIGGQTEGQVRR